MSRDECALNSSIEGLDVCFEFDTFSADPFYLYNNSNGLVRELESWSDEEFQTFVEHAFDKTERTNVQSHEYEVLDADSSVQTSKFDVEDVEFESSNETNISIISETCQKVSKENKDRPKRAYRLLRPKKCVHVWEFCRDLLKNSESLSSNELVEWTDRQSGVFKFTNINEVASLWGLKKTRKANKPMTFEKMARGIRFSETQGYFSQIKRNEKTKLNEHRFKFGAKAIQNCQWLQSIIVQTS